MATKKDDKKQKDRPVQVAGETKDFKISDRKASDPTTKKGSPRRTPFK